MSIYGGHKTTLGLPGIPARSFGPAGNHLMINLELSLNIAGSFTGNFCDIPTIPPDQIALQGDGDIQLVITVQSAGVPQNISGAHNLSVLVQKPDLTTKSFAAVLATNGYDGKLMVAFSPADLAQAGTYVVQANLTVASVAKSTEQGELKVGPVLVETPPEEDPEF